MIKVKQLQQGLSEDNGACLTGASLSWLQSKLAYNWVHEIKVTVTYKMYEVIHKDRLTKYLRYHVFLYNKVRDIRQNHRTMKYRSNSMRSFIVSVRSSIQIKMPSYLIWPEIQSKYHWTMKYRSQ